MNSRRELTWFVVFGAGFAGFYFLPLGTPRFDGAVMEAFALTKWYAREHVILCLLPAFWLAGAIGAFVSGPAINVLAIILTAKVLGLQPPETTLQRRLEITAANSAVHLAAPRPMEASGPKPLRTSAIS